MELIRPLYLINEDDIIRWAEKNDLEFIRCACRFTEMYNENENADGESKREEMKSLIKEMKKNYSNIDVNIFNSVQNVNLSTIISYQKGKEKHHFLDEYNKNNN